MSTSVALVVVTVQLYPPHFEDEDGGAETQFIVVVKDMLVVVVVTVLQPGTVEVTVVVPASLTVLVTICSVCCVVVLWSVMYAVCISVVWIVIVARCVSVSVVAPVGQGFDDPHCVELLVELGHGFDEPHALLLVVICLFIMTKLLVARALLDKSRFEADFQTPIGIISSTAREMTWLRPAAVKVTRNRRRLCISMIGRFVECLNDTNT